ncbi:MAG: sugar ABC transporter permease [Rhodobacteraceae bacterium]|nr:sugar ABC transporter permease [Paracoccaceae bacterium]MBR9819814.1 sugar ABC transporter permease [Paracoccaceae bacterium]
MIDFSSPRHRSKFGYLLLAPAVLLMALIIIYPILLSVDISLQDVRIARVGADREPWTTENYSWLFNSGEFWNAVWVTAKMVLTVGGISLIIGLATALLVNQRFRGRSLARLFVALPWAVPEVVATVIWAWMLDSSFGVINWLLLRAHLISEPIQFASNATAAFFAVCLVMIWKGYPLMSIMLLAGLQSIPEEQYQAARVDGANVWKRFIYVTLPNLAPVIGVTAVMTTLWVFRDFAIIYVLTQGGPIGGTTTLSILTFEQSFSFFKMGQGAAVGVVTMIICAVISRALVGRFASSAH